MPDNKVNLINREGYISGMPVTPSISGPGLDERGNPKPNMTVAETWENALNKAKAGGIPEIPLSSFHIGDRYDKTRPGTDFEEAHAQQQHWTEKMAHGIGKMGVLAGTTFVQGTVGAVNGLIQWNKTGKQSSFYDNDFNRQMDEINKTFEDKWANYYTAAERDASWYSPKKIFSPNFIFDGIIKNLGFSLGVIASGAVYGAGLTRLTQVLSNIPKIGRMVSIGKAAQVLAAEESALASAAATGRAAATTAEITSLYSKFIGQYKALTTAQRVAVAGLATSGEASFEAYHNMNEFRQRKIDEFREQNGGMDPSAQDLAEINEQASRVGNVSYLFNVAILSATNYIQFPKIFGSSYRVDKTLTAASTRTIGKIVREGDKFVAPAVKGNRLIRGIKGIAPYTFSATEAFEEGAQYAVTVGTQDFYDKKYNDLPTDFMNSVMEGITGTLTTDIGMENVLIGGLSGALMLGYGRYRQAAEKADNTRAALESEKRWTGEAGINTAGFSQFTKDTFDSVKRGAQIQEERLKAIQNGDILKSKDLEADYIINYLIPRIKYGRIDLVNADIAEYKLLASTEEGFLELQKSQIASEADTRDAFLKRLTVLENTAKNTAAVYETLQLRFGNAVDEKGNRVYTDQIIDKMVYATAKVADYDTRIRDLSAKVVPSVSNIYTILEDIAKGDSTSFNEAMEKIKTLDIIDTQKDELAEALEDITEMHLLRAVYLQEFQEIKNKPSKYKEVVSEEKIAEEPPVVDGTKTVKVKTKIGEKEIEIGTKYYVGKIVNYNKKGERETRPNWIVVLKDNGDGTLRIQDKNGKERDIEASVLEDYRLGKASVADSNPTVSFFMRNWDQKVKRKLKGQKTEEGWLEHDPETNQLFFVSNVTTKKGKVTQRHIPITLDRFSPEPGYKEGIYTFEGPITKQDEVDIKAANQLLNNPEKATIYALNTREAVRKIVSDLYEELQARITGFQKALNKKIAQVRNIEDDINDITARIERMKSPGRDTKTKGFRFKPIVKTLMEDINRLSRAREELLDDIKELEASIERTESVVAYFKDAASIADELPINIKDILYELGYQVELLQETIETETKEISILNRVVDSIEKVIESAMDVLLDLISEFKKLYPKVPSVIGQEWVDFLKSNPNFLKLKPNYKADLDSLEKLIAETEEVTIQPNEEKLNELKPKLEALMNSLKDNEKELRFKMVLLNKFEKVYNDYIKSRIDEKVLEDPNIIKDALGTADKETTHTRNPNQADQYEPIPKKSAHLLWRATMGIYNEDKPHQVRANRFGFNLRKFVNRNNIKGVFVTADNEKHLVPGLMEFIDRNKEGDIDLSQVIALVMVDDSSGIPVLVGEDGKALTEEQLKNPFDHIIYQVMPLPKLQWASGESMFRDKEKHLQETISQQYAEFRNRIFEKAKEQKSIDDMSLHTIAASFGHPKLPRIDGKIDYSVRTPVVDAGLIDENEMFDKEVVFIPTLTDIVEQGTTRYEGENIGRIFLNTGDAVIPLQNRKHTKKEAETIFKVLVQVARNIINKDIGAKHPDTIRLYEWLETVVYWGLPTTPEGKAKPAAYNSVFWEKNDKGEFVLMLSGKGTNFRFTPMSLEENKAMIVGMLENMYMNVKNHVVKNIDEPYNEILDIDNDGNPVYREWKNYQAFLLSDKVVTFDKDHKDNGTKRSDIPVTTVLSPLEDEKDMNRTSIYFYTTDNTNEIDIPETKEPIKIKVQPDKPSKAKTEEPPAEKVEQKVEKPSGATKFVYDGKTENSITNKDGKTLNFTIDTEGNFSILPKGDLLEVLNATIAAVKKKWKEEGKISDDVYVVGTEEKARETAQQSIKDAIRKRIEEQEAEFQKGAPKQETPPPSPTSTEESKEVDDSGTDEATKKSIQNRRKALKGKTDDRNKLYRLANERASERFEKEDWPKVEAWLKANFPGLPVYRVKNIIQATNGRLAWGMFKDAALYVYEAAEEGTAYHEVFEAVWKMFTTSSEQVQIATEFKSRSGEFTDRETGERIKYSSATPHQIKEQLAEEFRGYVLRKEIPPKPAKGRPLIVQLFYDIVNFIKKAFFGRGTVTIEEMFKNISTGKYKNRVPYGQLSLANKGIIDINEAKADESAQFSMIPGIPGSKVNQIVDSMIYHTIFRLIKNNESLFNLTDKTTRKNELYAALQNIIVDDILMQSNAEAEGATAIEADYIFERADTLAATVVSQWDNIVEQFENRITAYDIQFDENDIINVNEYQKSKEDTFVEGNKVDHFKRASGAIKLLIATMIEADNNGAPLRSSIGGPILIPISRTVVNLYNKLHSSRTPEEMIYRLREMAENDPNYRGLYRRLTGKDYNTKILKDGSTVLSGSLDLESNHALRLMSAFYTTFRKQNPEVLTVTVFENGDIAVGNTNLSTAASQLRDEYINAMLAKAKDGGEYLVYDKKQKAYVGNGAKIKKEKLDSLESMVRFLDDMGIKFDIKTLRNLQSTQPRLFTKFSDSVNGIRKSIANNEKIVTVSGRTLNMNKRLLTLGYVQASINHPEFDSTFFNVSNERTQSFIGTNPASDLYDFLDSMDFFTADQLAGTRYEYLLKDSFAQGSSILARLFNEDGKRRESTQAEDLMRVVYVSGMDNIASGKKTQSSKLTYRERLAQEININLDGYYLNLVPGDASMEWGLYMGNPVSEANIRSGNSMGHSIFKNYFISEVNLVKEQDRWVDKSRNHKEMRFFKSILGETLHSKILNDKDFNTKSAEELYKKYENSIKAALNSQLAKDNEILKENLKNYNLLVGMEDNYTFINIDIPGTLSEAELNNKLSYMNINFMIANIEMHKLIYADPYQYSDELKRIKNFNSPRQSIINGSREMNSALHKVWNKQFREGDRGYYNFQKDYFTTAVHEDIMSIDPEMEKYMEGYEETDGGGIITFSAYRNFRIRSSNWNDKEEMQYLHDMAYEELKQSGATEEELIELNQHNPKVRSAYTPIKPIVSGSRLLSGYNHIVLDKFALYPMSARLADDINRAGKQEKSNLSLLYSKMRAQDVDYIVFRKSRKVGVVKEHKNYNDDGSFNTDAYEQDELVRIPYGIIGVQADVPSDDSYRVTRGSQMTKLVTMDFMDAGVPIDFNPAEQSFDKRYQEWYAKSEEEKRKISPLYKEIKNNQELLEAKIEVGYRRLLSRLGIRETFNRGANQYSYTIVDHSIPAQALREEMLKREVSDNITDALDSFMEGNSILEATPAYHQIRNILYSIADKEVVSPIVHGGMKVQVSSALFEELRVKTQDINGKPVYTSDVLKFYKKDGKQVAEIMISRWFKSHLSDEQLLDYLNNTDEGKRVLAGVGFRIPTQKQNSIESFVIKRFLPEEFGDSIVLPSAIVRKTGSDFDIDKLTVYLKNVFMSKGLPRVIELKDNSNSTVDQRYADYVLETASKDTKKYLKFLSRDSVREMRQRHKEEIAKLREKYNIQFDALKGKKYETLPSSYDEIVGEIDSQDEYINMLFQDGSDIFRLLPDDAKLEFRMMARYIELEGIQGPQEIIQYMVLTQDMIDNNDFPAFTNVLRNLVYVYEAELEALGATKEAIQKLWDGVKSASAEEREIAYDNFLSEKQEHDMKYINRLAELEELMTKEEFAKLPILHQNSTKALENAYIESTQRLVSDPLNFERLTEPNSAKSLEAISRDIASLTKGKSFDYKDVGSMINRVFMSSLRHAFVTGKYAIGISAVNQTNHSLNQRQLIYIDPDRKQLASKKDQKWLGDARLKFQKFNKVNVKGKGDVATLSKAKNAAGEFISDIISQFIDGYVDISNGPWIIELGATPNVVATWFFLIKAGVPIKSVAYFMNQPIIRDYLKTIENNGYKWLFIEGLYNDTLEQYNPRKEESNKRTMLPSEEAMYKMINIPVERMNDYQKSDQQFILNEFMKYATMAQHMFYMTQGSNFDTANLNDPYLIFKKFKQLEKARYSIFNSGDQKNDGSVSSGVDSLLNNSFIGKLSEMMPRLRGGIAEILVSDQKQVRNVIETLLEPYVEMSDDDFVKIARKAVSDVFDYAVHMDKNFSNFIMRIMIKDGGTAKEIDNLMKEISNNPNHPLYHNHIVGEKGILRPLYSRRASDEGVNNVKVKGLQNKTYDQNMIIYGFREMRDFLKSDPGNEKLYDRLMLLGALQSGLSTSSISFTSVIPFEDFIRMYQDSIAKIGTSTSLNQFLENDVFYRNNWNNDDIVPNIKARYTKNMVYNPSMSKLPKQVRVAVEKGIIPPMVSVWESSTTSQYSFITYTWEKMHELLPSNWREIYKGMRDYQAIQQIKTEMRKQGDYSYINKALFKKVVDENTGEILKTTSKDQEGETQYYHIYKAINAWGDGPRANEFYDHPKQSIIDNGIMKVNEVNNNKIIGIFNGTEKINITNFSNMPELNKLPMRSSTPTFTYAGIGSRNTPKDILDQMTLVAKELEKKGYTLNTGDAAGADSAFAKGAKNKMVFKPSDANERTRKIAKEVHPNPNSLTGIALNLMARNTNQIFGKNLDKPVDFAIVWTPLTKQGIAPTTADQRAYYGKDDPNNTGGTGQAIALASLKGIPVINMANPDWRIELDIMLEELGTIKVSGENISSDMTELSSMTLLNTAFRQLVTKIIDHQSKIDPKSNEFKALESTKNLLDYTISANDEIIKAISSGERQNNVVIKENVISQLNALEKSLPNDLAKKFIDTVRSIGSSFDTKRQPMDGPPGLPKVRRPNKEC